MDLERIPGYMADYLSANGVAAEPAWSGRERTALAGPKAVVSVRKCQMGPAGFQDYLGERFDKDSGQWRELYGRKAELTLGLDLYAPEETEGAELERAVFRPFRLLRGVQIQPRRRRKGRSWSGRCSDWPGLWCGADRRTWE